MRSLLLALLVLACRVEPAVPATPPPPAIVPEPVAEVVVAAPAPIPEVEPTPAPRPAPRPRREVRRPAPAHEPEIGPPCPAVACAYEPCPPGVEPPTGCAATCGCPGGLRELFEPPVP